MSAPDEQFRREAVDQCQTLTNGLIELERGEADVAALFRTAHSLKGACRSVGLSEAGDIAHVVETLFEVVRNDQINPGPSLIDDAIDAVATLEGEIEGDAEESPAAVASALEAAIDAQRDDSAPADDAPPIGPNMADSPAADPTDEYDEDIDPDVIDALESASKFDDIDALLADANDPDDVDAEIESWGLLNDADDTADLDAAESDTAEPDPDPSSIPENPAAYFRRAKDEQTADDLDELESEIEKTSLGEFDDDDDMGIDDLLAVEPDEPREAAADTTGADTDPADTTSLAREADTAKRESSTGTDSESEPEPTPTADAQPDDSAVDVESAVTEIDRDEVPAIDTEPAITEIDHDKGPATDIEPAITETDPTDDSATDIEPAITKVDPSAVPVDTAETDAADTDDSPPTPSDPGGTVDPIEDATNAESDATAEASPSDADIEPTTDDTPGEPPTAADDPASESDDDEPTVADLLSDAAELSEPEATGDSEFGPDKDLFEDVEIDDADGESSIDDASSLGDVSADADTGMDVRMDEELTEFGEDLDGLLDVDPSEFSVPGRAASTIESSALDAEQFRSPASVAPPDPEQQGQEPLTIEPENADRLLNLAEELSLVEMRLEAAIDDADDGTAEALDQLTSLVSEYQRTVMNVRLTPLERAVERLPVVARDAARDGNKQVRVETDGTDVRLDRSIVDRLGDPLGHLVRNAVIHGIESPDERVRAGKAETGLVTVSAERVRDEVVIEVRDDGSGVDLDAIRDRAIEAGIVDAETAQALDADAVVDLLFESGLSTASEVTEVAGRGVGMDAVAEAVGRMDGDIQMATTPGEGTTVRLTLPVSVTLTEVLVVRVGEQRFAVPLSAIEQVSMLPEPRRDGDRELVRRADLSWGSDPTGVADVTGEYPLVRVSQAFDVPGEESQLLWFRPEVGDVAAAVDEVIETREVVIRPYGDVLGGSAVVSGAATVGDGETVSVLDPEVLAGIA